MKQKLFTCVFIVIVLGTQAFCYGYDYNFDCEESALEEEIEVYSYETGCDPCIEVYEASTGSYKDDTVEVIEGDGEDLNEL